MKMGKAGMMNKVIGLVLGIISIIIGFVIVFYIVGNLAPTLTTAAGNISASGLPLASLYASNGVLMIIFMIMVFLALLIMGFAMVKGKSGGY